jgi:hypothetical protein
MTLRPERVPPCPRCGAEVPVHHPRVEHLRMYGWRLFAEASAVNHCGQRQEWLLVPDLTGETARLVSILGQAG